MYTTVYIVHYMKHNRRLLWDTVQVHTAVNLRKKRSQLKKVSNVAIKKSTVNKAGNYTKPTMRKRLFNEIKAGTKGGKAGQWSARKAQMLAKEYKAKGGGYK